MLCGVAGYALLTGLCCADEVGYFEVKQAFDRQQFIPATRGFLELAQQGDARAMFYLGVIYDRGLGTEANEKQAFAWYERAAVGGHPEAQYNLGNAFKHGRGTVKSEDLATLWWQKAAAQRQVNAEYNLALQYYLGNGTEKSVEKAIFYFQEAAEGGHPKAISLISSGKIPAREKRAGEEKPAQERERLISEVKKLELGDGRSVELPIYKIQWLEQQDPQAFTVQMAVMSNFAYLKSFLLSHQLVNQSIVVGVTRENRQLYYVLLGVFADRKAANNKLNSLSPALRKFKPWARPFSELQAH